jgi:hypothetical protein
MSTNYTGSATATQAPAATPDPDNAPIDVLPADGDPLNAASVAQAFKVLADYIHAIKNPRSKSTSWPQALRRYRNARLQTMFAVDHLGLPSGRIVQWEEDWSNVLLINKGNSDTVNGAWANRWNFGLSGTGTNAGVAVSNPDPTIWPTSRYATLSVDTSVTDSTVEAQRGECITDANRAVTMQWEENCPDPGDLGDAEIAMGISLDDQNYDDAGAWSALTSPGVAFVKRTGDTNWQCYTKAVGGSAAYATTGVAANTTARRRFRIEILGANVADDSTARVNFFVDDTHVPVTLAVGNGVARPFFRLSRTATGAAVSMHVGVVSWRHNLYASDVVL